MKNEKSLLYKQEKRYMKVMLRNIIKYDKHGIMKTIIDNCFISGSTLVDVLLNGTETLIGEDHDLDFFCYDKTKIYYSPFVKLLKEKNVEYTESNVNYGLSKVFSIKIPNIVDGAIVNLIFPDSGSSPYDTINKTITKFDMQICSVAYVYKEDTIYATEGFRKSILNKEINPTKFLIKYFNDEIKLVDNNGMPKAIDDNYIPFIDRYSDRVKKYNKNFGLSVSQETEQLLNIIIKALKKV